MARSEKKLAVKTVEAIKAPGRYGDGGGLWLQVTPAGGKSWLLRYMLNGRTRAMGLGPLDLVSLADARERAREARRKLLDGTDPIDARREQRAQSRLEAAQAVNFQECAERYIMAHESGWKSAKHSVQWKSTLATTYPVIGALPVAAVDTGLVLKVIEPIWATTRETASRLRGRIEAVLDWAAVRGYRTGENPARWKGHLAKLLPGRAARKVRHHPALPYAELPIFMSELRNRTGISAQALEFTILTAARTSETINATWAEIDFQTTLWTIPSQRMKATKEHRVPLSERAIEILKQLPRENDYLFIGAKADMPLSNMAMLELMRDLRPGFVPHGFRSTFRDWAAELTNFPSEVIEMALAHTVGNKVEAAYRRGDLFEKRQKLMTEWSRYCQL